MHRALFVASLVALLASLTGLAAVLHQRSVQTFGAVDGLPDPALDPRPAQLRAANVELLQYDDAELARALEQLQGFGWLRQTFDLSKTDGAQWERVIAAAHAHDFQLIAVLSMPPPAPTSAADFGEHVEKFAAQFGDRIDAYQILDEPNLMEKWGRAPSATEYAALLEAAYSAIKRADPTATVIAAALAPTVETGPDNLSDLLYLQQLYDLGASRYFDAAAGKPYGFYTGPDDRQANPQLLNFSRFTLLREVMVRNGDGHKLLWGGNFGWNTRSDSIWGVVTPEQQVTYTLRAYERAAQEWPWAGPLVLENYQPAAPPDDPRWGFALADPNGVLTPLGQSLLTNLQSPSAVPGNHTATHPAAQYTGAWQFSELGADIPEDYVGAQIRFEFQGSDLALRVRRGDYRAYLYVTVDGRPANLLPQDGRGAYLVLTSPDLRPQVEVIPVASGLDPDRTHVAVIEPERGWGQWAIAGFSVGRRLPAGDFQLAAGGLLALLALSVAGLVWSSHALRWEKLRERAAALWQRLGDAGQLLSTFLLSALLFLSTWLTFETEVTAFTRRFGDAAPLALTALTAGLFYFSPSFLLALAALVVLFVLFYLRLDIAPAFLALFIPFYLFPRMLWERGASLLEFCLWLTFAAWLLHYVLSKIRVWKQVASVQYAIRNTQYGIHNTHKATRSISSLDISVLALLLVSALSTLAAEQRAVAVYEFRTVLLGAAAFYFLLRVIPLDENALWRIVDFFILGGVAVAAIGLYQYVSGAGLIVTEEGVARIRSVYGSPNNLALYLGRTLPVALAVAVIGPFRNTQHATRRILYGLACLIMAVALLLTFSRGALVLGVPALLAVIVIGWQGRRGAMLVGVLLALGLLALPVAAGFVPRLAGLFDLQSGTGFFRLNLWLSAWRMFLDHPWLGVGPDNFLYAYRGFYILPQAWQEPNLSHPHNLALDFLSRLGLFGFVAGVWLLVNFWRVALSPHHPVTPLASPHHTALRIGLMALVADMLAHGLVDHSFFLVDLAFAFMLALALVQRLR
ncbi:MAG: O-antigen ligase family protein [Anaerolineales bacterium]|nr:O-antigen ligase family protein [Anaerolineales bacterium]